MGSSPRLSMYKVTRMNKRYRGTHVVNILKMRNEIDLYIMGNNWQFELKWKLLCFNQKSICQLDLLDLEGWWQTGIWKRNCFFHILVKALAYWITFMLPNGPKCQNLVSPGMDPQTAENVREIYFDESLPDRYIFNHDKNCKKNTYIFPGESRFEAGGYTKYLNIVISSTYNQWPVNIN